MVCDRTALFERLARQVRSIHLPIIHRRPPKVKLSVSGWNNFRVRYLIGRGWLWHINGATPFSCGYQRSEHCLGRDRRQSQCNACEPSHPTKAPLSSLDTPRFQRNSPSTCGNQTVARSTCWPPDKTCS